jgi:hypothetical protein
MIGPPSFVGGSFGPGWVAIIIVRIAASGIATPKKPESATRVVRVPPSSGKAISTVAALSSPARPNSSPPSVGCHRADGQCSSGLDRAKPVHRDKLEQLAFLVRQALHREIGTAEV